jgi:hypothetical protein
VDLNPEEHFEGLYEILGSVISVSALGKQLT